MKDKQITDLKEASLRLKQEGNTSKKAADDLQRKLDRKEELI